MTDKPQIPSAVDDSSGRTLTIDTIAFAKSGKRQEGSDDTKAMARLDDLLSDEPANLSWSMVGSQSQDANGSVKHWLRLSGQFKAAMPCARCMDGVPVAVELSRTYLMAPDETVAAKLDSDTDDYDVLVASRNFALTELLEDEILMALPHFVVHPGCEPLPVDDSKLESPFAVLAAWRGKRP
jgi:uncharacterized protein